MMNCEHYFMSDVAAANARNERHAGERIANDNHKELGRLQETAYAELLEQTRDRTGNPLRQGEPFSCGDDERRAALGELARLRAELEGDSPREMMGW